MDLKAQIQRYELPYIRPATTSRGALQSRTLWILELFYAHNPQVKGRGECGIIPGLSPEDRPGFESHIHEFTERISGPTPISPNEWEAFFINSPALQFAYECALLDLKNGGNQILFQTPWIQGNEGIPINGLVWMDSYTTMLKQAKEKIAAGFHCIKIKVGAIDFDQECALLHEIRKDHKPEQLLLRLDANGAFTLSDAQDKLKALKTYHIHSIEQPVAPKQPELMASLCEQRIIDIALDEELIGINPQTEGPKLLHALKPQYIILKPSLIGGFEACNMWIQHAVSSRIGWWATSALESNIGLNAIAQWVTTHNITGHQGLGTGALYTQNFEPHTQIWNGNLYPQSPDFFRVRP